MRKFVNARAAGSMVFPLTNNSPRAAMASGEWNGNHNDRAFLMIGVPAYPFCASKRADL
jgi:hypothetical protein